MTSSTDIGPTDISSQRRSRAAGCCLESPEEVGPHRRQHDQADSSSASAAPRSNRSTPAPSPRCRVEQLLELIDDEQHVRLGSPRRPTQIARHRHQRIGPTDGSIERLAKHRARARGPIPRVANTPKAWLQTAASSATGSSRGTGTGPAPTTAPASRRSRGTRPARTSDDFPDPDAPTTITTSGRAQAAHPVQQIEPIADLRPPDRNTPPRPAPGTPAAPGYGRATAVPVEHRPPDQRRRPASPVQPGEPVDPVRAEIDHLLGRQHAVDLAVIDPHRQQHLAQRTSLGDLREAPLRRHRCLGCTTRSPPDTTAAAGTAPAPSSARRGSRTPDRSPRTATDDPARPTRPETSAATASSRLL